MIRYVARNVLGMLSAHMKENKIKAQWNKEIEQSIQQKRQAKIFGSVTGTKITEFCPTSQSKKQKTQLQHLKKKRIKVGKQS